MSSTLTRRLASLFALMLTVPLAHAIEDPGVNPLAPPLFQSESLQVSELAAASDTLADSRHRSSAQRTGSPAQTSMVDLRTGRFTLLMPSQPLIAGDGVGNTIAAAAASDPSTRIDEAGRAFRAWVLAHQSDLRIDPSELVDSPRVTMVGADHFQIYQSRQVGGIKVRDAAIMATIKQGNLILVGLADWGTIAVPQPALLGIDDAVGALAQRIVPHVPGPMWKNPELVYVPVATPKDSEVDPNAPGLSYRLAHALYPRFSDPDGRYEVLVDARDGEVLSIQDTVHHVATPRSVKGGVYPLSNNGSGAGGTEQANWPMPFTTVTTPSGVRTSDVGGALAQCVDGSISAGLSGQYVRIVDTCGASSLSGSGDLNFGTSAGTDCTTPGSGGPGNTHAARTGYHELNMIMAMARSQVPGNEWLKQRLNANMNIVDTCNASWNGVEVNFFRSGGGCGNTGEIAGVFDHEWGHGMDNNDGVPTVSSPGEGIADLFAALRLGKSCIGPGFDASGGNALCTSQAPPAGACLSCSGVRDIDFANHQGGLPFTVAMADTCGVGGSAGPCGGSVHCEGLVYSQAVWDLWKRDLPNVYGVSDVVAHELVTQLTFQGASGVNSWFACANGSGGCGNPSGCGCASTSGYMQYLAADDDNGSLLDGTPHMSAIQAAFARHGIACATPTVVDSGCSGTPSAAPVVTTAAMDGAVSLNWTASAGASSYRVYRTDGVFGCDFGKILIGTVAGTTFLDTGLQNGRSYHYVVVPTGSNDACFSTSSSCSSATPIAGAKLELAAEEAQFTALSGDGDAFVDNCESTRVSLPISNAGVAALSNVRVIAVSSPSHPGTIVDSALPLVVTSSQAACAASNAQIEVTPVGVHRGDAFALDITVTSDEFAATPRTVRVETTLTESNFEFLASKTFNFDTDNEGWTTVRGTFVRDNAAGGGAASTTHYLRSSTLLDNQCDTVESPIIMLAPTSTLSLSTRYNIETASGGQWWDRANISGYLFDTGESPIFAPSAGRLYNASGIGGSCGMNTDPGWAGVADAWATSDFSAVALQAGTLANRPMRLRMRYGTDAAANGYGLRFDQVTLTNVSLAAADTQSDSCVLDGVFKNGFE